MRTTTLTAVCGLFALVSLVGVQVADAAACSLVTTNYTCPAGELLARTKWYITLLSDGTPGLRFWGASCTKGTTFGNFSSPFPTNQGQQWNLDHNGNGCYEQFATYKNPSPPAALGCAPIATGIQTWYFPDPSYGTMNITSPQTNANWNWSYWEGPYCTRYEGGSFQLLNSISITTFNTTPAYVSGISWTCWEQFFNAAPDTFYVRPNAATVLTSSMINIQSKSGSVVYLQVYTAASIGSFEVYSSTTATWGASTSFMQLQISGGSVRFISQSGNVATSYQVTFLATDTYKAFGYITSNIILNFPPTVSTAGVLPSSMNPITLTSTNLNAKDVDNVPTNITWTVTSLPAYAGNLTLSNTTLTVGSTFTQLHVNSRAVQLYPALSPGSYLIGFNVSDPLGGNLPATLNVTFVAAFGSSDYNVSWLSVSPPRLITLANLINPVSATPLINVTYQIQSLTSGMVVETLQGATWTALGVGSSFNAYQVFLNQTRISTNATTFGAASLAYVVTSGTATATGNYNTYVNFIPTFNVSTVTVPQSSGPLNLSSFLSASDVESSASGLVYTLTKNNLTGVSIYVNNGTAYIGPLAIGAQFTQDNLTRSDVQLRFNSASPSIGVLGFSLSDGLNTVSIQMSVNHLSVPKVTTSAPIVPLTKPYIIPKTVLFATSNFVPPQNLTFTVVTPFPNGTLSNATDPTVTLTSFTAADIANGTVQFAAASGRNGTQSARFNLTDGYQTVSFNLTLTVNTPPVITINQPITCDRNGSRIIYYWDLSAQSSSGSTLTFTADSSQNGCILKRYGAPCLSRNATWTQTDINNWYLSYYANNTLATDLIPVTVSDGYDQTNFTLNITIVPATILLYNSDLTLCGTRSNGQSTVVVKASTLSASAADTLPTGMRYSLDSISNSTLLYFELFNGTSWNMLSIGATWWQSDIDAGMLRVTRTDVPPGYATAGLTVRTELRNTTGYFYVYGAYWPTVQMNQPVSVFWYNKVTLTTANLKIVSSNDPYGTYSKFQITSGPSRGTMSYTTFYSSSLSTNTYYPVTYNHTIGGALANDTDSFQFTYADATCPAQTATFTINVINRPPAMTTVPPVYLPWPTSPTATLSVAAFGTWGDVDGPNQLLFTLLTLPNTGTLQVGSKPLGIGGQWNASDIGTALAITGLDNVTQTPLILQFNYSVTDSLQSVNGTFNSTFLPPPVVKNTTPVLCNPDLVAAPTCMWTNATLGAVSTVGPTGLYWSFPEMARPIWGTPVQFPGYAAGWPMLLGYWVLQGQTCYTGCTYTQNDINLGNVGYKGAQENYVPGPYVKVPAPKGVGFWNYSVTVSDRVNPPVNVNLTLQWENPPVVSQNNTLRFSVVGNQTAKLLNTTFAWTDADNATTEVLFTLTSIPRNGSFSFQNDSASVVLQVGSTWTIDDINKERLVFTTTFSNASGGFDSFTYNVTDGLWNLTNKWFSILNDDVPTLAVNQSFVIDWMKSPYSQIIWSGSLAYADNFQKPEALVYTITDSPLISQIQYRLYSWSTAWTRAFNASYCTCNYQPGCVPPVNPCYYTFTQADLNIGKLQIYGTVPGNDSFRFTLSDGLHLLSNQSFAYRFYSPPVVSMKQPTLLWNQSLILSTALWNVTSPEPTGGSINITYTLKTAVADPGLLQLSNGTDWSTLSVGSNWTQADVDSGRVRFYHNPVNTSQYGTYSISLMLTDGITSVPTTPTVYVPGVLSFVNPTLKVITPGETRLDKTFFGVTSPNTGLSYTITSLSANLTLQTVDGSNVRKPLGVGSNFTTTDVTSPRNLILSPAPATSFGNFTFSVNISDGLNPTLSVTYPIYVKAVPFWTNTSSVVVVPQQGLLVLTPGIVSANEADLDYVLTLRNASSFIYYVSAVSTGYIQKRVNATASWSSLLFNSNYNWTVSDMFAGNVAFLPGSLTGDVTITLKYNNGWQEISTVINAYIIRAPTASAQPIILAANANTSLSTTRLAITTDPLLSKLYKIIPYPLKLTIGTLPGLGVVLKANTTLASDSLLATANTTVAADASGNVSTATNSSLSGALQAGTMFTLNDLNTGRISVIASNQSGITNFSVTLFDNINQNLTITIPVSATSGALGNYGNGTIEWDTTWTWSQSVYITPDILRYTSQIGSTVTYIYRSIPYEFSPCGDEFKYNDNGDDNVGITFTVDKSCYISFTIPIPIAFAFAKPPYIRLPLSITVTIGGVKFDCPTLTVTIAIRDRLRDDKRCANHGYNRNVVTGTNCPNDCHQ
ncbi:FRAS1- extracellular matrix protein 1 [Borealophlyctis nickersoniae]|nr:FRAS1- extracellular matrix protein 1 [Borealophlyctis nickersoniae]